MDKMTPLQALVYWTVYVISLLIIHPALFVYRWGVVIAWGIADVAVKGAHWVARRGRG